MAAHREVPGLAIGREEPVDALEDREVVHGAVCADEVEAVALLCLMIAHLDAHDSTPHLHHMHGERMQIYQASTAESISLPGTHSYVQLQPKVNSNVGEAM